MPSNEMLAKSLKFQPDIQKNNRKKKKKKKRGARGSRWLSYGRDRPLAQLPRLSCARRAVPPLTITSRLPPRAIPSFRSAGFLFSCSRRFFWYSSSSVSVAMPFPSALVMRETAPAAPPGARYRNILLRIKNKKKNNNKKKKNRTAYERINALTLLKSNKRPEPLCTY